MIISNVIQKNSPPLSEALIQKIAATATVTVKPVRYEGKYYPKACVVEYNEGAYLTFLDANRLSEFMVVLNNHMPNTHKWKKVNKVKDEAKRMNVTERYNANNRLHNLAEAFRQSGNTYAANMIIENANLLYNEVK